MEYLTTSIKGTELLTTEYDIIARNNYHREHWISAKIMPHTPFVDPREDVIQFWIQPEFWQFLNKHNIVISINNNTSNLFTDWKWSFEFTGPKEHITKMILKWF